MRKIIRTDRLRWDQDELLQELLDVRKLPDLVIIETVEED